MLTPADYIPHFQRRDVGLVVRLNKKCYNERNFVGAGMRHAEHYYPDRSCLPLGVLHAVVQDLMCGSLEHMPVWEEAACRTEPTSTEVTYTFTYNTGGGYMAASNKADSVYADCAEGRDLKA